ncbi:MAG: MoaD/ThiS family protein, partial [Sandaracinaceae bacterium]
MATRSPFCASVLPASVIVASDIVEAPSRRGPVRAAAALNDGSFCDLVLVTHRVKTSPGRVRQLERDCRTMRIKVLYFAAVRELRGLDEETLEVPEGLTVTALRAHLEELYAPLRGRLH